MKPNAISVLNPSLGMLVEEDIFMPGAFVRKETENGMNRFATEKGIRYSIGITYFFLNFSVERKYRTFLKEITIRPSWDRPRDLNWTVFSKTTQIA